MGQLWPQFKKIKNLTGVDVEIMAARSIAKAFDKLKLPYEEKLINPKKILEFISQKWDIKQKPFNLPQRGSVSQSKDLTQERIDLYVKNYKNPNENIIYNKSY